MIEHSLMAARTTDTALPHYACCSSPGGAARLPLRCLLFRSSWLTLDGDPHVGAAGVLHRRSGVEALAVQVGVAGAVPERQCAARRLGCRRRVLWWRSRRMRSRSPSAARFQFLEVARYWARGVAGVGIGCKV